MQIQTRTLEETRALITDLDEQRKRRLERIQKIQAAQKQAEERYALFVKRMNNRNVMVSTA